MHMAACNHCGVMVSFAELEEHERNLASLKLAMANRRSRCDALVAAMGQQQGSVVAMPTGTQNLQIANGN